MTSPHQYIIIIHCLASIAAGLRFPLSYKINTAERSRENVKSSQTVVVDFSSQYNNLHGHPGDGYYIDIEIGTPPQRLSVLVDTGSSNLAVAVNSQPAITRYFRTNESSTYQESDQVIDVPYTKGHWSGHIAKDAISLPSMPFTNVTAQFAGISKSEDFFISNSSWQGILGLAYPYIARPDTSVIPYFDAVVANVGISNTFSMQLCGTLNRRNNEDREVGGTMIWGGVDGSLYRGQLFYTRIVRERYYEVTIADLQVSGTSLGLDCKEYNYDKTIVDSGTTNLRLPKKVFNRLALILGETITLPLGVTTTGFLSGVEPVCWHEGHLPYESFPNISLCITLTHKSVFKLTLSPQQYLRHIENSGAWNAEGDCFMFAVSPSDTGTVLGAVVMEAFYTVFDRGHRRVGFALSTCRGRDPTKFIAAIEGPLSFKGNATECMYDVPQPDRSALSIVGYVMAAVCGVCLLPFIVIFVQWQVRRWCRKRSRNTDSSELLDD